MNPWPILGGCAKSIAKEKDFIRPDQGVPGDLIILTKPLGTQPAAFMRDWSKIPCKWERAAPYLTLEELDRAFKVAVASMSRLNLAGKHLESLGEDIVNYAFFRAARASDHFRTR